jgi:ferredoxin
MRDDRSETAREQPGKLALDPGRCTGCLCCALACSLRHTGGFNPERAFIRVAGVPEDPAISFVDGCTECLRCAAFCTYGALSRTGKKG